MSIKNKKPRGFSLIELLFAMVFLSVIVFGVVKLQTSNLTLSNTKQLELKAHFYAVQALEIADALGYDAVAGCIGICHPSLSASTYILDDSGTGKLDNDLYEIGINHDDTDLSNGFLVTSRVTWTDSSGEHVVEAKRVIFK